MSGGLPTARWHRPTSLAKALAIRAALGSSVRVVCGATDLMVGGWPSASAGTEWLDIAALPELLSIVAGPSSITIGAAASCARIAAHPVIATRLPMLVQSALQTGSVAIRNRATLGGNLMNASPAADNPPVLMAHGATLTLASVHGSREVACDMFNVGYRLTVARDDELLVAITVPMPPADAVHFHRKVGTRRAQAIAKVALAALIQTEAVLLARGRRITCARIGLASAGPAPVLARHLGATLAGMSCSALDNDAISLALDRDIAPIDGVRSTASYRRRVALNLVLAALAVR